MGSRKKRTEREVFFEEQKRQLEEWERTGAYVPSARAVELMNQADMLAGIPVEAPSPPRNKTRAKPRKKNPQTKLKAFFLPKTNDEGFPWKLCRYVKEEKKFVYFPPSYPPDNYTRYTAKPAYCLFCRLQPCIQDGHSDDFIGEAVAMDQMGMSIDASLTKMYAFARKLLVRHFGRDYVATIGGPYNLPKCTLEACDFYTKLDREHEGESSAATGAVSEKEFEFE